MSETRKQRTPEQLIVEVQAKLAKLQVRQAKQDAKANPELAPLFEQLEELRKTIREAKKGLGKSPVSFASRIAKHELWINKIMDEQLVAEIQLSNAEEAKAELENAITAKIASLSTPNTLSAGN